MYHVKDMKESCDRAVTDRSHVAVTDRSHVAVTDRSHVAVTDIP